MYEHREAIRDDNSCSAKSSIFFYRQDYEFNFYLTNDVTDITNGRLRIKPILTDNKFSKEFVLHGRLDLEK